MADNGREKAQMTLKAACDEAYIQYPHSCSHAVWHVIKKYIPDQPYLPANTLILHNLTTSPHWQEVQLSELSKLASEGALVVGGAVDSPHGHVIVVYPGPEKFSGGYHAKNKKGKKFVAPATGIYALAMSTSIGSWPGSKSKGDKTVADPWNPDAFKKVKFWKYVAK